MLLAGEFTEQSAEGFIHGVKAYTAHKTARMGLSPLPNDANGNPNLNQSPLFQHTKRHLVRHQSHIQAPKKQLLPTIEKKKLVHTKLVRRVPKAEDGVHTASTSDAVNSRLQACRMPTVCAVVRARGWLVNLQGHDQRKTVQKIKVFQQEQEFTASELLSALAMEKRPRRMQVNKLWQNDVCGGRIPVMLVLRQLLGRRPLREMQLTMGLLVSRHWRGRQARVKLKLGEERVCSHCEQPWNFSDGFSVCTRCTAQ